MGRKSKRLCRVKGPRSPAAVHIASKIGLPLRSADQIEQDLKAAGSERHGEPDGYQRPPHDRTVALLGLGVRGIRAAVCRDVCGDISAGIGRGIRGIASGIRGGVPVEGVLDVAAECSVRAPIEVGDWVVGDARVETGAGVRLAERPCAPALGDPGAAEWRHEPVGARVLRHIATSSSTRIDGEARAPDAIGVGATIASVKGLGGIRSADVFTSVRRAGRAVRGAATRGDANEQRCRGCKAHCVGRPTYHVVGFADSMPSAACDFCEKTGAPCAAPCRTLIAASLSREAR